MNEIIYSVAWIEINIFMTFPRQIMQLYTTKGTDEFVYLPLLSIAENEAFRFSLSSHVR